MKRLITIKEHYPKRMSEKIRSIMPLTYSTFAILQSRYLGQAGVQKAWAPALYVQ